MVQDGIYLVVPISNWSPTLVLDVPYIGDGGEPHKPKAIQQFPAHSGPNQKWEVTNQGNDEFTIVSVWSGLALDVPGGYPIQHLLIQQYPLHGGPNQRWKFESIGIDALSGQPQAKYQVISVATGLALDIPANGISQPGTLLQQYPRHTPADTGWNQHFRLFTP